MLSKYLSPQAILLQVPVKDWKEAVEMGGALLVDTGKCEPRYVDAMVRAVQDLGPYMVLAPGLSLAHARPEDGALQVGMSIVSLSTPVDFGSEANDPVQLVISFCGIDHSSHIEMLKSLAEFLVVEENQNLLKSSNSIEEILKAFQ
ncbi:PTS maltose transporter subunit IIBC [Ornatilinea apprima]|uniref:Ascorbate-specific PTS system EIIA component n=1 Tax=Ornatilinea apprima TaxID=1134406 RepID=A0A0P6XPX6_9CHLR|nr:PTS sugar transporter subunit IIA [Ornatilinea apprima]KPL78772.1 PTS maltose transporter subunit IIBC [Ornatilinea apprima]